MKTYLLAACAFAFSSFSTAKDLVIAGQEFPPFNMTENENVTGAVTDTMKKICEKLKYKCTFSISPVPRVLSQLENGDTDIGMTFGETPDRAVYANFSPTVCKVHTSYVGTSDMAVLKGPKDLTGWNVGIVRGSVSGKLAAAQAVEYKFNVVEELENRTLVKKVASKRYGEKGAVFGPEESLLYIGKKEHVEIKRLYSPQSVEYKLAYSKKKLPQADQDAISKALTEMKKDGSLKAIFNKYSVPME